MTRERKYGLVAIITSLALFLPLFFASYTIRGGGSENFFLVMLNFTSSGTPALYVITALSTIALIALMLSIMVVGFVLLIGATHESFLKTLKWLTYITAIFAIISATSSILLTLTYRIEGFYPFFVGIGSVILMVFAVILLFKPLILSKAIKH